MLVHGFPIAHSLDFRVGMVATSLACPDVPGLTLRPHHDAYGIGVCILDTVKPRVLLSWYLQISARWRAPTFQNSRTSSREDVSFLDHQPPLTRHQIWSSVLEKVVGKSTMRVTMQRGAAVTIPEDL